MYQKLLDLLDIKQEEASRVFILIFQSIFIGIFYGSFEIGGSALFLEAFDADMIPQALLISGVIGIVFTSTYSRFHSKINFSNLAIINLIFITLITALIRFGFEITEIKWLVFGVFVVMGPLYIISLLGFWGTVSRMFTLRQGKRLFGLIDTGQVAGIIISGFAIPILLTFNFKTVNTLLLCALSICIALIIQFIITRKFKSDISTFEAKKEKQDKSKSNVALLFKNKYVFSMVLFVAFSMIAAFFILNSFLSVSKEQYPDATDLAKFLGFFTATVMIFSLLIKFFVYSNLMKTYGLRTALLLSPVVLGILTLLAVAIGSFGYTKGAGTFFFFFLLITMSRLISWSLKMSIEGPAFKLLYQSLDADFRYEVQAKLDGVVNEFSALFAGLLLTGLAALQFFKLIHFSYTLVFALAGWAYVTYRLYRQYKNSLESSLESSKEKDISEFKNKLDYRFLITSSLKEKETDENLILLRFTQIVDPLYHDSMIEEFITSKYIDIRKYIINYFHENMPLHNIGIFEKALKKETDPGLKKELQDIIDTISHTMKKYNNPDSIKDFSRAKEKENRILACKLIGMNKKDDFINQFSKLIRDPDLEVRKVALKTINIQNTVYVPQLIESLSNPETAPIAISKLISFGEGVISQLEHNFYKTDITIHVQVQLLRIMGLIGGEEAVNHLLNKLTHNNREIVEQAIISLRMCNYISSERHKQRVIQVIDNIIGTIAWDLAALASLNNIEKSEKLQEALQQELVVNNQLLLDALSVAYDPESVIHVKENLDIGSAESIGFAIELLDLFVDDEIKPKLFPLFEDISESDKTRQLENHYPIKIMPEMELLKAILNRNPNEINRYTKHCALIQLMNKTDIQIDNAIIAQIFNPDNLLSESSAIICHSQDPDLFKNITKRLEAEQKLRIERTIDVKDVHREKLQNSKIDYILQLPKFQEIPGNYITMISDILTLVSVDQFKEIPGDYLKDHFLFLASGSIEVAADQRKEQITDVGFIQIPFSDTDFKLVLNKDTLLYSISRTDVRQLLINNQEFTQFIINNGFVNLFFN